MLIRGDPPCVIVRHFHSPLSKLFHKIRRYFQPSRVSLSRAAAFTNSSQIYSYCLQMSVTFEGIFAFAIIKYGMKVAQSDLLRQYLRNIQSFGSSGVAIAWLTFMSTHLHTAPIVFLGVLPIHAAYALFPTILLSYLFTPLSNAYANLSGLCYYQHIHNPGEVVVASSAEEDGEGDMIEVRLLGPSSDTPPAPVPNNNSSEATRQVPLSAAAESFADTLRQRFGTWFRPRGEGARGAEEATPLLQEEADNV
eukprot:gene39440-48019_t